MNVEINLEDITSELLEKIISSDMKSAEKLFMKTCDEYFKVNNTEISSRKKMMMLVDDNNNPYLKNDYSKANHKARHSYLAELINQCTNYLAGKPIKLDYSKSISKKDSEALEKVLYQDNNLCTFLQDMVTNTQLYGKAYMRVIKDKYGNTKLMKYDPKEIIMFYDDLDNPILTIRYFTKSEIKEINKKKEFVDVDYAEIFNSTTKDTWRKDKEKWEKINSEPIYGLKITYGTDENSDNNVKEEVSTIDTGVFPIIEWDFNSEKLPTLTRIKDFIDLQDLNLSDLANNVEDIQEAIWILENYTGQNLQEFMEDLKVKKAIKVGNGGDARAETVQIPTEARTKLYELCDKNIYKFGFGVNFTERDSLGNVTGVGLKWSYAPLEQKANSIENNGQEPLNALFNILFNLLGFKYDSNDLEFHFDRTMISNEEEQTRTVMSASSELSQKTILTNLPMVQNVEEEIERLKEEDVYEEVSEEDDEAGEETEKKNIIGDKDNSDNSDNRDKEKRA